MRKLLLTTLATASVLGSFGVVAPNANAAIERCGDSVEVFTGAILKSCIFVDSENGRAEGILRLDPTQAADLDLLVTINRSGGSATKKCPIHFQPGDPQPPPCFAYATNPPGVQAWRTDSNFGGFVSSPTIYDT